MKEETSDNFSEYDNKSQQIRRVMSACHQDRRNASSIKNIERIGSLLMATELLTRHEVVALKLGSFVVKVSSLFR